MIEKYICVGVILLFLLLVLTVYAFVFVEAKKDREDVIGFMVFLLQLATGACIGTVAWKAIEFIMCY